MAKTPAFPPRAPVLVWFREDLRLSDNPALSHAANSGAPLVCLYVFDESGASRPLGGASRWWLAGSLRALEGALRARGAALTLRRGDSRDIVPKVAAAAGAMTIYWNRRYEPAAAATDAAITDILRGRGVEVRSFQASLLHEPKSIRTAAGGAFSVFGAFWRAAQKLDLPRGPLPAPARLSGYPETASERLDDWTLEPGEPDWAAEMRSAWRCGEEGAQARLAEFLNDGYQSYAELRDRPDRDATSRLSPHLRFGEISPFQIMAAVRAAQHPQGPSARANLDKLSAEIGWREFAYHLLDAHPDIATRNLQARFDAFPWRDDASALASWRAGRTGYPLVDAGMRQLWRTGWMHNRVRMVAASFLCKHLLIDWRAGERWFWETLVDADPANNPASWQWVAGTGTDAAPFFRIFNPQLQGQKFDPDGDYVRRFVPELGHLPASTLHGPGAVSADLLTHSARAAKPDYPAPIVEHKFARQRALAAFAQIQSAGDMTEG